MEEGLPVPKDAFCAVDESDGRAHRGRVYEAAVIYAYARLHRDSQCQFGHALARLGQDLGAHLAFILFAVSVAGPLGELLERSGRDGIRLYLDIDRLAGPVVCIHRYRGQCCAARPVGKASRPSGGWVRADL
jgi:hypothetical protein